MLLTAGTKLAKKGNEVKILADLYYDKCGINDSTAYKSVYRKLIGTVYEGKKPDFLINNVFYEFESYEPPYNKGKISNMLHSGLQQSSRVIINNTKGATDRWIKRNIYKRLTDPKFNFDIDEVWVYEKGEIRLLYKKQ